jgi:Fe(3+) dicitrate transport protein
MRVPTSSGAQDQPNASGDTSSDALIPGIGVIYGTKNAHVFSGVHVGYAPPRLTSAISPKGTPAQLDPEKSYNYEVGTRLNHRRWLHLEGTFFMSTFTNQVVAGTGDTGTELVNGGKTRHLGFEGAGVVGIGRLLKLPTKSEIDVGLRYTYNHATFVGGPYDGNYLPYAPQMSVTATVDVEHPSGVVGQVAWTHVSDQFSDQANTNAPDATGQYGRIPAYNIVDLGARYRHKPTGLTLRLTVKNALDDPYIASRRPSGIFVGGFRQIMLGLRWDWEKLPAQSAATAR